MSQILRMISTEDNLDEMKTNLNQSIKLTPKSSVALAHCNVKFDGTDLSQELFRVSGEIINYSVGNKNFSVGLTRDVNGKKQFISELEDELNYQTNGFGYDWEISQVNDGKSRLSLGKISIGNADYNLGTVWGTWNVSDANKLEANDNTRAKYVSKNRLARSGFYHTAIYNQTESDIYFGYISVDDDVGRLDDPTPSSFSGLLIPGSASADSYKILLQSNVVLDTLIPPLNNDIITIIYTKGRLVVTIVQNFVFKGPWEVTIPEDLALGLVLKHYVENRGNGTAGLIGGISGSQLQEFKTTNLTATKATIDISKQLGQYLGFNELVITENCENGETINYDSEHQIAGDTNSKGVMVILSQGGIVKGFDGGTGDNLNIIDVIPQTANISGTNDVIYTPTQKTYLALDNYADVNVSNFGVRFAIDVDGEIKRLKIRKGGVCTLNFRN